ncbi:MAG TPA: PAS domain-containing protein, partial [Polyangiaceae bacterium]|nr:PAS domain-containing protein [Polyangiaceae bacterium]
MPDRPFISSFVPSSHPESAVSTPPVAELLERAIARTDEGIALYDASADPSLVYANASFYDLLAATRSALDARPLQRAFDDAYVSRALRAAVARHEGCTVHANVCADSDAARELVFSLSPIRDDDGQLTHWLCTARPLASERHSATARSEHERLSAVTLVAAGLAHEINNPLASITTNLEWLVTSLGSAHPGRTTPRPSELPALSAALVDALAGAERIEAAVRQLQAL